MTGGVVHDVVDTTHGIKCRLAITVQIASCSDVRLLAHVADGYWADDRTKYNVIIIRPSTRNQPVIHTKKVKSNDFEVKTRLQIYALSLAAQFLGPFFTKFSIIQIMMHCGSEGEMSLCTMGVSPWPRDLSHNCELSNWLIEAVRCFFVCEPMTDK